MTPQPGLVERLRELSSPPYDSAIFGGPMRRAADTITTLEAEVERLRAEVGDWKEIAENKHRSLADAEILVHRAQSRAERKLAEIREIVAAVVSKPGTHAETAMLFAQALDRIATLSSTPERREG